MHREGNACFLLSCIIADSDHICLFGSPNAQQAHRELKPLSFSHCLVTLTFIVHAICHYSLSRNETKLWAPSSVPAPSSDHCALLLEKQPCLPCTQQENPSIFTDFPSSLFHTSPSKTLCSKLQEAEIGFWRGLQRVRCSFYPAVVQRSPKPIKRKETKNMFAKIKLKPSSDGVTAIYAHTGCLPRMFLI